MQELYIPMERLAILKERKNMLAGLEKSLRCKINVDMHGGIGIEGEAFEEYLARNVLYAFGRGFDIKSAELLLDENYYFSHINITDYANSKNRIKIIKARLIGSEGRAKKYIETVSSAKVSIYGDTVSFIGSMEQIKEATAAVKTIIEGGSHKLAYRRMEATHRKNKTDIFA